MLFCRLGRPVTGPKAVKALTVIEAKITGAVCEKVNLTDILAEHIFMKAAKQCQSDTLMAELRSDGNE